MITLQLACVWKRQLRAKQNHRTQASSWVRPAAALCCAVLAYVPASALQLKLDRRAIEEAIYIGQSRIESERIRFHAPYRVQVAQPPVDWIDVVTPFHRLELAAETNARRGGSQFGQRQALEVLSGAPDQVDLLIELTFHPLNTFVGVPAYQVELVAPGGTRIAPRRLDRYPRFGPRLDSSGPVFPAPNAAAAFGGGQPVLGGTLIAVYDGTSLDAKGRYGVVLMDGDGKTELARSAFDLAKMR
jgi:hypothetical protein